MNEPTNSIVSTIVQSTCPLISDSMIDKQLLLLINDLFRYLQVTLKSLTAPRISLHPPQCLMISPISCSFGSVTCSRKNYSCVFISLTDYIPKLTVTMFRTMSDIHSSNFDKQNICNQRVISLRSLILISNHFQLQYQISKKKIFF